MSFPLPRLASITMYLAVCRVVEKVRTLPQGTDSMKWFRRGLLTLGVVGVLLGLGVARARPGWLPAWARVGFGRLASWVHEDDSDPAGADEDEDEKRSADGEGGVPLVRL